MEILLLVLSVFSVSFFIAYVHAVINLKKTTAMLTEIMLLHLSMQEETDSLNFNNINAEDIHKENFIKFLSDSRDWAYTYIEDVQKGLKEFISEVEPSINHFNKYGIVVEGSPHYSHMQVISKSFEKLKKLLPEDNNDRR